MGASAVKQLAEAVSITRATGGGRFNHLGVWEWLAANQARINHDPATLSTSASTVTIGAGSKTFAVSRLYTVGEKVRATADANNYMTGIVTAAAADSVTIQVSKSFVGSGSYSAWTLIVRRGILTEEQRTNLLLHSGNPGAGTWGKTNLSVTTGAVMAPDGVTAAAKLAATTTLGLHGSIQSVAVTGGTTVTHSIYAKAGEYTKFKLFTENMAGAQYPSTTIDLVAGTITAITAGLTGRITALNNGWYRIEITGTINAGATTTVHTIRLVNESSLENFAGDGTSGFYTWNSQVEIGASATSAIPSTTAQVTRSADVVSVNELSPWFNKSEGVLFVEVVYPSLDSTKQNCAISIELTSNGNAEKMQLRRSSTGAHSCFVQAEAVQQALIVSGTAGAGVVSKQAMSYAANDFAAAAGGAALGTDSSGIVPTVDKLLIGSGASIAHLNGHIRTIRVYPRRKLIADLQSLSA